MLHLSRSLAFACNFLFAAVLSITTCDCRPFPPKIPPVSSPVLTLLEPTRPVVANKLTSLVYIDDKFSAMERPMIEAGLTEWDRATNGAVRFIVQRRGSWNSDKEFLDTPVPDMETHIVSCTKDMYIYRTFSGDKIVRKIEDDIDIEIAGYAHPACTAKYFIIVADKIYTTEQFIAVTVHEMGHMLGLQHLNVKDGTAMYPNLGNAMFCLTSLDMGQFSFIWNVDLSLLKPCKGLSEHP